MMPLVVQAEWCETKLRIRQNIPDGTHFDAMATCLVPICFRPGSNRRPSMCKASVINCYTQWCPNHELILFYSFFDREDRKNKSEIQQSVDHLDSSHDAQC